MRKDDTHKSKPLSDEPSPFSSFRFAIPSSPPGPYLVAPGSPGKIIVKRVAGEILVAGSERSLVSGPERCDN